MLISAKTVEANLSRVYTKLGIHSRAELGRHFVEPANVPPPRRAVSQALGGRTAIPRGNHPMRGDAPASDREDVQGTSDGSPKLR
jgi:hypothetical protein